MSQVAPEPRMSAEGAASRPDDAAFYRQVALIRYFEETLLKLFSAGKLMGTTHTYSGQEADAVAVLDHMTPRDVVFSNHRCHGHYLALTGDVEGLLAELLGLDTGICAGKGGSQHLCRGNFYTNGVQGGIVPLAVGAGLAEKRKGSGALSVAWLGDGTLGEGVIYESFNMASLWDVPVLFVIENNGYAQTTPVSMNLAGSIAKRTEAFGIPTVELASTDAAEIWTAAGAAVEGIRARSRPHALVLQTYRFGPHSKGDDFRSEEEMAGARKHDPKLVLAGRLDPGTCRRLDEEVAALVDGTLSRLLGEGTAPA